MELGKSSLFYQQQYYIFTDSGNTSNVYFGIFTKDGCQQKVAIKKPKSVFLRHLLIREAMIMSQFDHVNIIKVIGVYEEHCEVALEFMELKSLSVSLTVRIFLIWEIFMQLVFPSIFSIK